MLLNDEDQSQGIIERGQAIEANVLQIEDADNHLGEALSQLQSARAQVETLEARREELQARTNLLNQNLSDRRTDHSVTQVKLEEAAARQQQIRKETAELQEQIAQENARRDQARTALADVETRISAEQEVVKTALGEERDKLAESLQQSREAARQSREEFHSVNVRLESIQSQLKVSISARERMLTQQSQLAAQIQNIQQSIADGEQPIPEMETRLKQQLADRLGVEQELKASRGALETLEAQILGHESRRNEATEKATALRRPWRTSACSVKAWRCKKKICSSS